MRKYAILVITLICLVGLVGCHSADSVAPSEKADKNAPIEVFSQAIEVATTGGQTATLSEEDAEIILEILENGEWYDEPTECFSDCMIMIGENRLTYHSDCGTFNGSFRRETIDHRGSLMTDDETQQLINSILEQYVTLGQYE